VSDPVALRPTRGLKPRRYPKWKDAAPFALPRRSKAEARANARIVRWLTAAFRSNQQSAGCCRIGDEAALLVGGSNMLAHRSFPT